MIHRLKIEEPYANAVVSGDKNFEVRYDDRGYQKGDIVRFQTVNDKGESVDHMINGAEYIITYALHGFGIKEGWCVFGIKEYFDGGVPN